MGYARDVEYDVRFLPSNVTIRVATGTSLLAAARSAGLPIASACFGDGLCARCGVKIVEGARGVAAEGGAEVRAKYANRVDPGLRLACRVEVACDLTITAPYW